VLVRRGGRKFVLHINHIAKGHILPLFGSGRDGVVTVVIITQTGGTLIIAQGYAISLKPVVLFFEHMAMVLIQRDAELVSDGNKWVGCRRRQPGTAQIKPYAGRDFFGVRPPANAVRSLDHRIAMAEPGEFLGRRQASRPRANDNDI